MIFSLTCLVPSPAQGVPSELALRVHQLYEGKLVVTAHARVVLAERRGDVRCPCRRSK